MDTALLRTFEEVARSGSITGAAERLGYTQSAVSRQIAVLEHDLGVTLFDRRPRGVRLTAEGRALRPHALAVGGRLATVRRELASLLDVSSGHLRVGAFATANAALVPGAMADFRADHPDVSIALTEGLAREHVDRLHRDELDLAVVTPTSGVAVDGLDLHHLFDEPMFVALPADHRLAGRRTVRLRELGDDAWVAGSSRLHETLLAGAALRGFDPEVVYVVAEWSAKLGVVAAGLGVTLLPSLAAAAARPDVAVVGVHEDDVPRRPVHVATLAGVDGPPALAPFVAALERVAKRMPRSR